MSLWLWTHLYVFFVVGGESISVKYSFEAGLVSQSAVLEMSVVASGSVAAVDFVDVAIVTSIVD